MNRLVLCFSFAFGYFEDVPNSFSLSLPASTMPGGVLEFHSGHSIEEDATKILNSWNVSRFSCRVRQYGKRTVFRCWNQIKFQCGFSAALEEHFEHGGVPLPNVRIPNWS